LIQGHLHSVDRGSFLKHFWYKYVSCECGKLQHNNSAILSSSAASFNDKSILPIRGVCTLLSSKP
jgi:hypothetical protein